MDIFHSPKESQSQDELENIFSNQRHNSGLNNSPTVREYRIRLSKLFLSKMRTFSRRRTYPEAQIMVMSGQFISFFSLLQAFSMIQNSTTFSDPCQKR